MSVLFREVDIWALRWVMGGHDVSVEEVLHMALGLPGWTAAPLLAAIGTSLDCSHAASSSATSAPAPAWVQSLTGPCAIDGADDDVIFLA
jgi:hypothetical protein